MYAVLGDIQFDLITYFDGFDSQFGADYAEHPLLDGKPRLQFVGDKLDEIRIQLAFHANYCDPESELIKLRDALTAHQAMALVLGNGDYKGWFVLTDVQTTAKHTDKSGTLIALDANITLREFVGDKVNPVRPPAVQPTLPPAAAQTTPASQKKADGATTRERIRRAVTSASQAQSALRVSSEGVRIAQNLRKNPLAAMSRVPSLLANMKQIAGPLEAISPALSGLSDALPETASIVRGSVNAAVAVKNAQDVLSQANTGTVTGSLDYAADQLSTATDAMQLAAPATAKLAARVATRSI